MKFAITKLAAATTLALAFSNVNAAFIDPDDIIINIVRDGLTGPSMLINTNVSAGEVVNGTLTSWTSNVDLTAAINSFIAGSTNVQFWVTGSYVEGPNQYMLTDLHTDITAAILGFTTESLAFTETASFNQFATATVGLTEEWKTGIPAGDPSHFVNPNMNAFNLGISLGTDAAFLGTQVGFFLGVNQFTYDTWRLDADGTLSYGVSAVPVPAAVWLFGSGLIGLVGVARRRKA